MSRLKPGRLEMLRRLTEVSLAACLKRMYASCLRRIRFYYPCGRSHLQERIDVIVTLNALRAGRIKLSSCLSPHLFSHVLKISKISRCVLFVILRSGNVMSL